MMNAVHATITVLKASNDQIMGRISNDQIMRRISNDQIMGRISNDQTMDASRQTAVRGAEFFRNQVSILTSIIVAST
jgi:hypothetical protein